MSWTISHAINGPYKYPGSDILSQYPLFAYHWPKASYLTRLSAVAPHAKFFLRQSWASWLINCRFLCYFRHLNSIILSTPNERPTNTFLSKLSGPNSSNWPKFKFHWSYWSWKFTKRKSASRWIAKWSTSAPTSLKVSERFPQWFEFWTAISKFKLLLNQCSCRKLSVKP